MGKVELLAPAGNYDALKGSIKAGADAVYLGGRLYSARAYADNFTQEEICAGIHLAHVFGVKVYLTVNTLVKERELDDLYAFLLPFYESGLDGVIIQDLGILRYIRAHFPGLSLHASTQMTLTGLEGAGFIKEQGVSRIVPARELSLKEIKRIKAEVDVEIEAFIHGAMCYCYSGQCLFSSILGGRSGNRGRCAQPCRLPYQTESGNSSYSLSMRDMCSLGLLPELIEAGVDSFKIEGRMKKPAYAAGVTAIYRKYIDLYYENKEKYRVSQEDMSMLRKLYIRSKTGEGYYKQHNGRDMITWDSPAYSGTDERLLADVEREYIKESIYYPVSAEVYFKPGEPARLTLQSGETAISCTGDTVQKAVTHPLSEERLSRQIQKNGENAVRITSVQITSSGDGFLPIGSVNQLRRQAADALEKEIIRQRGLSYEDRKAVLSPPEENKGVRGRGNKIPKKSPRTLHVSVSTREQLEAALTESVERIYIDYTLLEDEVFDRIKKYQETEKGRTTFYGGTPYIVRDNNRFFLETIKNALLDDIISGVLIKNIESFSFFERQSLTKNMVLDANLYLWNREALSFWEKRAAEFYLPIECNLHEWKELLAHCPEDGLKASALVYGRLPMMITANCLGQTKKRCNGRSEIINLKDRYGKRFPVYMDCKSCYNIIYNSVPLSLHPLFEQESDLRITGSYRLDLTVEDKQQTLQIIRYFAGLSKQYQVPFYKEYTTGHLKRGVE